MTILNASSFVAIRAAIDLSLDTESLPDTVIALPIYMDAADLEVKTRDTAWASRTGDSLTLLTNACVYLTAARLAPAMPRLLGETYADGYQYQMQAIDWEARARWLRAQAELSLDALIGVVETDASDVLHSTHVKHRVVW